MRHNPTLDDEIPDGEGLDRAEYAAIAAFRFELRRFIAFSEAAALAAGLSPQQHQVMLAIAGREENEPATVGFVARRMLIAPNTATELVARMVESGLLTKSPAPRDRRRTELALTERANALLSRLTDAHLNELRTLEPALVRALQRVRRTSETP